VGPVLPNETITMHSQLRCVITGSSLMKHVLRVLSIVALVGPAGLFTSGCTDEFDEFEDMDQLRPERPECAHCEVVKPATGAKARLGISTAYSPSSITNVSIEISNAAGTELLDYGNTLSVPNDPNLLDVPDDELCKTVGTTGNLPTAAYVEFEITDATGVYTVGGDIPINCS
jgi:hypothetical protein